MVIKYGGNAMIDDDWARIRLRHRAVHERVAASIRSSCTAAVRRSTMLTRLGILGIPRRFRVPPDAMDVVRMVDRPGGPRSGRVDQLPQQPGGRHVRRGWLFTAERRGVVDGEEIDLGLVGDVAEVRTEAIAGLIAAGGCTRRGQHCPDQDGSPDVNADRRRRAGVALSAERLVVLTDVEGLYRDWPNSTDVITELSASELRELMPRIRHGAEDGGVPPRG